MPATQPLTNGWKLARVPDVKAGGKQISLPGFDVDPRAWLPAVVPGTVLTSYEAAGRITNPYYSTNLETLERSGLYNTNYWYRNAFYVPSSYSGKRIWLNFDALNWYSDVYVNGALVGSLNGPFKRGKFDITSYVKPGATNCVAVLLYWCDAAVKNSPAFIAAGGWDFMPPIPGRDVGLYQNVYLSTSGPVQIIDPFVKTTLPLPDTSPAKLTLRVGLTNSSARVVRGILYGTIRPDQIMFQTNVVLNPGASRSLTLGPGANPQLSISHPALWWPNGYGPQNLHSMELSFKVGNNVSDQQRFQFGIRQYSYDTNQQLVVYCNGRKIFCKGGNWGMPDAMLKYTPAQLDMAVRLHQKMHFTMIRCWHGNSDLNAFYDACDKYGIMVWDEFWLNGSQVGLAPTNTALFESNAVDKIKRLRNRACLAVYCGENEATPPPQLNTFLNHAISQLDGTRIYIPASNSGCVHGGGPYAVQDPFWYYSSNQNASHGFTTEIGLPSVPPLDSLSRMMPAASLWPIGNAVWQFHDWDTDIGNKGLDQYVNAVNDRYGTATNIADFCQKAQLLNEESYQAIFEAWNAKLWHDCSGVLLWMSQPAWPSTIWQTYDWYFGTGGAYFGCRKACEPIHIQWDCNDGSVKVVNCTLQPLHHLSAEIQVFNLDGTLKYSTNVLNINVAADSVAQCGGLFCSPDLAFHHPATASSVENNKNIPSHAVDNLYGTALGQTTRWSSRYADPQWLCVDLGSNQPIDTVILLWEAAYAKSYQIQVSDDAAHWKTVWSTNSLAHGGYVASRFAPVTARYVRMYASRRGTRWGDSIYEFRVYRTGVWDNHIRDLSPVHFIRLKLKRADGTVLSRNAYWRGITPCDYTALAGLPRVQLQGDAIITTDGATTHLHVALTNATSHVAFGTRLKLVQSSTKKCVLPAIFSDNYFLLFPHESKTISIELANKDAAATSRSLELLVHGWNVVPTRLAIHSKGRAH